MCFLNKYAVQHVACIHKKFPTGIAQDSALDKEMVAGLEWWCIGEILSIFWCLSLHT